MVVTNASIDFRNDDVGATRGRIPGRHRIDGGRLLVLQVPLARVQWVVGHGMGVATLIRFGELDVRVCLQSRQRRCEGVSARRLDLHGVQP